MLVAIPLAYCAATQDTWKRPPGPPPNPFLDLFDTNQDGNISKSEIDQSSSILRKLDSNGNGKLTPEELPRNRPPAPPWDRAGQSDEQQRERTSTSTPSANTTANLKPGTVLLREGFVTDAVDGGRPVALIAASLGVSKKIFRDAFSRVTPARGGHPSAQLARANKQALMDALGKHGITNERLDEVSNFYRYRPQSGELWKHSNAKVELIVSAGKVTGVKIVDPGFGYSSAPKVVVAGYPNQKIKSTIGFSKDTRTNGRLISVEIEK